LSNIQQTLIILFILSASTITASTTIVKGNSKGFKGKELVLYTYSDFISSKKEQIGFTTITENGTFNFEFDSKATKKVFVKIEDKSTSFYIKPGEVYNINLSYSEEFNKGRIYDKELSLNFNFPVPTELNQQISKFNGKFDDFFEDNSLFFKKRDHSIDPKLKSFKTKMLKESEGSNSNFVRNYINYSIALTQSSLDVSYKKSDAKDNQNLKANLYLEYIHEKPVLYYNPEYTSFFKAFFRGEFKDLSLKIEGYPISNAINDKASYSALSDALQKFSFLNQNDELKNYFMLNGLLEVSRDKYFTKDNIIKILNEVISTSKYPEHKIIAANIIEKITIKKFGLGSNAPLFTLIDNNKNEISLSQFEGKPVYINFWANWSIPSQKEMKIMALLHKKYKNKIHFVSVCADNDFEKMSKFLAKNPSYNWTFLHLGNDKKTLANYNVVTFPTYILVDGNQKIYKAPAGRPGGTAERATEDNIERDFFDLTKK
jgi:thiol-disulfide isomerase/thioredoxin